MAILKIYLMEYSIAMRKKMRMEFFKTRSIFNESTAFEEMNLVEYSMAMHKKVKSGVLPWYQVLRTP